MPARPPSGDVELPRRERRLSGLRRARVPSAPAATGGGIDEHLIRLVGPATIIVFEVEAPTRIASTAASWADTERLARWVAQEHEREEALRWALLNRDLRGGPAAARRNRITPSSSNCEKTRNPVSQTEGSGARSSAKRR